MRTSLGALLIFVLPVGLAYAEQDMLLSVDLTTPNMTQAEMSRADIEAMIVRSKGTPLDLMDKRLSGLDLSGLDLRGANLRLSRLNRTVLRGTDLSDANLDQAWLLKANLRGAKLVSASLFGVQMRDADLSNADLTRARSIGDFRGANLSSATLVDLKGGADMKNQSMGLMRTVFTSVNLEGANLRGADLSRARLDFSSLNGADLTGAILMGSDLSGADMTGAMIAGADFTNVDVSGAKLRQLKGQMKAKAWDTLINADRAFTEPTR